MMEKSLVIFDGKYRIAPQSVLQHTSIKPSVAIGSTCLASNSLDDSDTISRRKVINNLLISAFGLQSVNYLIPTSASYASGGATAGGVYLLSAKQRYNARVEAGMKKFLKLSSSFDSGDIETVKDFFVTEEDGGWKDSSAAGYLLSNAFRRSSSTPPDKLPAVQVSTSVVNTFFYFTGSFLLICLKPLLAPQRFPTVNKKWKAFAAEIDVLQKTLKKKDKKAAGAAKASYQKAVSLLDAYLELVELPPVIELER